MCCRLAFLIQPFHLTSTNHNKRAVNRCLPPMDGYMLVSSCLDASQTVYNFCSVLLSALETFDPPRVLLWLLHFLILLIMYSPKTGNVNTPKITNWGRSTISHEPHTHKHRAVLKHFPLQQEGILSWWTTYLYRYQPGCRGSSPQFYPLSRLLLEVASVSISERSMNVYSTPLGSAITEC